MRQIAKCSLIALALAGLGTQVSAAEVEFHGYARAGVGLNGAGGGQVCFGLANADTKYRLGNECDYTLEPTFTARFQKNDDKSAWGIVFMPSYYRTYAKPGTATFDELPVRFGQIYLFGESVPQLAGGRIWGGRRFYDRLQTGINDQFLENEDGDGAGIEDMNVGPGKLSVAWLLDPNDESSNAGVNKRAYKLTTRYTDIPTVKDGAIQFWAGYYGNSVSDDNSGPVPVHTVKPDSMVRFAVYHTLNNVLGGGNLVGLKVENGDNHQLWRVVLQQNSMVPSLRTNFDFITEFRSKKDRADSTSEYKKQDWFTIGGRTDTQIAGPFRALVELGHDRVKPEGASTQQLTKLTGALAMSSGNDAWSRPTFRLFYTYAKWNDAAKLTGGVYDHWQSGARLKQVYGDATAGSSFGVQAEAWW